MYINVHTFFVPSFRPHFGIAILLRTSSFAILLEQQMLAQHTTPINNPSPHSSSSARLRTNHSMPFPKQIHPVTPLRYLCALTVGHGRTGGRSDGWTVARSDGRTDGQTVGRSDGRSDGLTVGRTVGRSDGRSDGRPFTRPFAPSVRSFSIVHACILSVRSLILSVRRCASVHSIRPSINIHSVMIRASALLEDACLGIGYHFSL